jgi:pilus assembly protein CpaF
MLHHLRESDRIVGNLAVNASPEPQPATGTSLEAESLVEKGVLTAQALEFLRACIWARLNVAISGAEGSGKRMLLHALSSCLVNDGEVLAVQNPEEPSLDRKGITVLQAHLDGDGPGPGINRHYLLSLVPKMHPTGLIIDRVEGVEAMPLLRLLFAMNGVLFTIVADSAHDALLRLEQLAIAHAGSTDAVLTGRMLSTGLDLVVHLGEWPEGLPIALSLTEVAEADDESHVLREIFTLERSDESQAAERESRSPLRPTGLRPLFLGRMESLGISFPDDLFA